MLEQELLHEAADLEEVVFKLFLPTRIFAEMFAEPERHKAVFLRFVDLLGVTFDILLPALRYLRQPVQMAQYPIKFIRHFPWENAADVD